MRGREGRRCEGEGEGGRERERVRMRGRLGDSESHRQGDSEIELIW